MKIICNCLLCNKEIHRTKSQIKNNIFCSRTCSVSYNNSNNPKRKKKEYFCETCNKEANSRRKYCSQKCNPRLNDYSLLTILDLKNRFPHILRFHSSIRDISRRIYFSSTDNRKCEKCSYDKHIEVCHINDVSTFSKDTLITTVNDINNLIGLCPNCHWELDNII